MAGFRRVNAVFSHTIATGRGDPRVAPTGGVSLLDYLCKRFPYHPRPVWEEKIRSGKILVDGEKVPPESEMRPGLRVEYRMKDYEEPEVPISFREIVCGGDLALVHKPAGLPVHKTSRVFVHTLANLYRLHRGDDAWSPLNRLDVETSGLVAFARGREALGKFSPQNSRWIKIYLAAARGTAPESGRIEFPLAEKEQDPIRSRMHPDPEGKPSITWYRRLLVSAGNTLLLLRPLTGRMHQIRAHLAAAGFPVIGDKIYREEGRFYLKRLQGEIDARDLAELGAPHHLLHAFHLEIRAGDGSGIRGTDAELPLPFLELFSELSGMLPNLENGSAFRSLVE